MRKNGQYIDCGFCKNKTYKALWQLKENRKYCSYACRNKGFKGRKLSDETRQKMSVAFRGRKFSDESKLRMSIAQKGKKLSAEQKKKIGDFHRGKKRPPKTLETRLKLSLANSKPKPHLRGENGSNWSGGKPKCIDCKKIVNYKSKRCRLCQDKFNRGVNHPKYDPMTPEKIRIRSSLDYKLWREAVFKRDNWTCLWCMKKGGILNADHIKPFSDYPALRLAIDNGRTLCINCHKKTDTYGLRGRKLSSEHKKKISLANKKT